MYSDMHALKTQMSSHAHFFLHKLAHFLATLALWQWIQSAIWHVVITPPTLQISRPRLEEWDCLKVSNTSVMSFLASHLPAEVTRAYRHWQVTGDLSASLALSGSYSTDTFSVSPKEHARRKYKTCHVWLPLLPELAFERMWMYAVLDSQISSIWLFPLLMSPCCLNQCKMKGWVRQSVLNISCIIIRK